MPTAPGKATTVKKVNQSGTVLLTVDNALVTEVTKPRNGTPSATFTLLTTDAQNTEANLKEFDEIQIWRAGQTKPYFWGYLLRPEENETTTTFRAVDLRDYFNSLDLGRPRVDLLGTDLDVGMDIADWTVVGVPLAANVTNNVIVGTRSIQLNNNVDDTDAYIERDIAIGPSAAAPVVLSMWFWVSDAFWVGPAIEGRGLYYEDRDGAGNPIDLPGAYGFVPIDENTPRESWQRVQLEAGRVAGMAHMKVRGYSPGTHLVIGLIRAELPESLSWLQTDVGEILESLSVHAQDPTLGKIDLNIGRSHTVTGIKRDRSWQFADHHTFGEAMSEFNDIVETAMVYTATTRTWTVNPSRTTHMTPLALGVNCCFPVSRMGDGSQVATSVTARGNEATGASVEEVNVTDASGLGGLIRDKIVTAPTGALIDHLRDQAKAELAKSKNAVRVLTVTVSDPNLIDAIEPGDIVTPDLDWGRLQVHTDPWRVEQTKLDPRAELLTLTLNKVP